MCIELKKRREWIDEYFDCPYICVWFPNQSRRYSRRLPEFYVFGSLERVIDTPAGCPRFVCCQLSDNGLRGHLPRVYIELLQRVSTQSEFSRTLSVSFPIGNPRALLNRCNPTTGPKTVSRSITGPLPRQIGEVASYTVSDCPG